MSLSGYELLLLLYYSIESFQMTPTSGAEMTSQKRDRSPDAAQSPPKRMRTKAQVSLDFIVLKMIVVEIIMNFTSTPLNSISARVRMYYSDVSRVVVTCFR